MAKPGPAKKPTALRLIEGNPSKRPINDREPQPTKVFKPRCPRGMSKIEQAKWREVCRRLSSMRVLTIADLDALEMYVRNWCAMMEALTDVKRRGRLVKSRNGAVIWNPSWSQYRHSEKVCRQLQGEFGMTPSSRSSLIAEQEQSGAGNWSDF